jgi:hypothetical protein
VAVKRLAAEAVLGEAPEDLRLTLKGFDRDGNFFATTIGGCTSELRTEHRGRSGSQVTARAGRPQAPRGLYDRWPDPGRGIAKLSRAAVSMRAAAARV